MLLNYRVSNFKSIGEAQEFSTVPGRYRKKMDHVYEGERFKSLKFSSIFGANASGKSNFVESIYFLRHIILRGNVPRIPKDMRFKLKDLGEITSFEVEVGFNDKILIYGISMDIRRSTIYREYLYHSIGGVDNLVYDIKDGELQTTKLSTLSKNRVDIYMKDLQKGQLLLDKLAKARDTNKDSIFLYSGELYNWFVDKLVIITPASVLLNKINVFTKTKDTNVEHRAIDILESLDTGITDIHTHKISIEDFIRRIRLNIKEEEKIEQIINDIYDINKEEIMETTFDGNYYRISINKKTNQPQIETLAFKHCNNNEKLFSYNEESDGTKRLIEFVNVLYEAQMKDRTYIVDEIDRSLHSNLTIEFIKKFLQFSKNNKSQLIITTHETNILDFDLVRQDEVWLIDRDKLGMSNLIPLSEYNLRSEKARLDVDYLEGRYGGVPNILNILKDD